MQNSPQLTECVVELLAHFIIVGMVSVKPQRNPGRFTLLQVGVIKYLEFILDDKILERLRVSILVLAGSGINAAVQRYARRPKPLAPAVGTLSEKMKVSKTQPVLFYT